MKINEIINEAFGDLEGLPPLRTPDKNDPYEQGWRTFFRRGDPSDNPYERGTPEYKEWDRGYEAGESEPGHYDESVEEGSMTSAAKNPSGPKFGGYYGATQKGAPKPGQGFGAAESVGSKLSEVAPPGMEDMVLKLKKQYPDNPERAFATAWSIYNKKKGKK